ncbi:29815_t:CDS:1 [Gigaspora margarita]|uniref:29815_t:CDS:1 n=1 Tax=Gigaspora margarita TaxID=4874 RepID=A0ABM8VYN0_GIGMA|nr:29815_t:CDS:1 [Gigaspora margarita]
MSNNKDNSTISIDECQDLNQEILNNKNSDIIIAPSTNQIIKEQPSPQNIQIPLKSPTFLTCSEENSPTSAPCESAYYDVYGVSSIPTTSSCCIKSTIKHDNDNN